jgi:hypothetical protein
MRCETPPPHRVLIAGGGVAGLEALWWPPTRIAGRYLAPYLAKREEAAFSDADRPSGQLVEFTPEGHGR